MKIIRGSPRSSRMKGDQMLSFGIPGLQATGHGLNDFSLGGRIDIFISSQNPDDVKGFSVLMIS